MEVSRNLLKLPPHHPVHNPRITLDDLDHLCRDILVGVIRHGSAVVTGFVHFDGRVHRLEQVLFIDAGDEETGFVGADSDTERRVRGAGEQAAEAVAGRAHRL